MGSSGQRDGLRNRRRWDSSVVPFPQKGPGARGFKAPTNILPKDVRSLRDPSIARVRGKVMGLRRRDAFRFFFLSFIHFWPPPGTRRGGPRGVSQGFSGDLCGTAWPESRATTRGRRFIGRVRVRGFWRGSPKGCGPVDGFCGEGRGWGWNKPSVSSHTTGAADGGRGLGCSGSLESLSGARSLG